MPGRIFLLLKLGVAGASAIQWVEGRDAVTHPTNAGRPHGKQLPGPQISAALPVGNPGLEDKLQGNRDRVAFAHCPISCACHGTWYALAWSEQIC